MQSSDENTDIIKKALCIHSMIWGENPTCLPVEGLPRPCDVDDEKGREGGR